MNTIIDFFSGAFDFVHYYARELCLALLVAVLFVGGNHLLHVVMQHQEEQRAVIHEFSHPQSEATYAPASKSCAWLKTDGTNTTCIPGQSAP
ncbi:hypothetical protein [Rhodanobacter aciditrophus]|uniref:hypothetical protein n=1 Tax=Rhodanobacter aciditrophus TaxID=1623218 RepID=UPI003CF7EEC4